MESSDARDAPIQQGADAETPACQTCRSRKLRCTRELPACSRCVRLGEIKGVECVYDYHRNKPGVKIGIIQTLTQRVELLEAELDTVRSQQERLSVAPTTEYRGHDVNTIRDVVSSLMEEWRSNNSRQDETRPRSPIEGILVNEASQPRTSTTAPDNRTSRKRRRQELPDQREPSGQSAYLPSDNLVNAVLDAYFSAVHPFIPIIHEMLFRSRLRDPAERPKLIVVLHAMMVSALRYVANERLAKEWITQHPDALHRSREYVLLSNMNDMTVENIQALIIIAFVHIGDGNAKKAWPTIGTLSRAVVLLGLNREPDETEPGEACLKPLQCLPPARVWTEAEERRRVFWNVFLLDRWNMNLSSDDVQVRLPSDGLYWVKEEPVTTPYFNIWDSSMARLGKSVSFIAGHFASLADKEKEAPPTGPNSERVSPAVQAPEARAVDVSTIGSFAYCIEATEALNRVVKFFLQRPVDLQNRQAFSAWLTRFKELDLQLIHWKMFLPRRWKDSNISREPAFVHMDPNLTLAHITHNTSMILLHQSIAYPRAHILEKLQLASTASAETCQLAALETANIVQKYLQYTPFVGLVSPQFSFCTFISAHVILGELFQPTAQALSNTPTIVHSNIHKKELPDTYKILLSSLQQMSDRWTSMNPELIMDDNIKNFAGDLLEQLQVSQEASAPLSFDYITEVNRALGVERPARSPDNSQWIEERRAQQRHSIIPVTGNRPHYISNDRQANIDVKVLSK
ncbi:hypothetical protein N7451_005645 [Penicillium sp. IBT 35674x]|nr:hypothetical protein N7451_005645 [Penicillium sp. IBT 35674x]